MENVLFRKNSEVLAQTAGEVLEPPFLEAFTFRNCGDVVLRAVVSGYGGNGLDVMVFKVFSNLNGSMI